MLISKCVIGCAYIITKKLLIHLILGYWLGYNFWFKPKTLCVYVKDLE